MRLDQLVSRVAAMRHVAGVFDQSLELFGAQDELVPRRAHHVFFDHDAAKIVGAIAQTQLGNLWPLRQDAELHVVEVIEEDARDRQGAQIVEPAGLVRNGELSLFGLEAPGDKGAERLTFVLQIANAAEVFDTVFESLDVAEHHARGAADAQRGGGSHTLQPFIGGVFVRRDDFAHAIDEDFASGAGDGVEPGGLQPLQCLDKLELADVRDVDNFGGRKRVQNDVRILLHDEGEDVLVVVDLQLGIEPALEQNFDAALFDRVADLGENLFIGEEVSLVVAGSSVEGAELASDPTHVGVVQDSTDDVGHPSLGHSLEPAMTRERRELQQVGMLE